MNRLAIFGISGRMGAALLDELTPAREFALSGALVSPEGGPLANVFPNFTGSALYPALACAALGAGVGAPLMGALFPLDEARRSGAGRDSRKREWPRWECRWTTRRLHTGGLE